MVDHSKIDYPPFRRSFYIEVPELARMSEADVITHRTQLDDIKVRGKVRPLSHHDCISLGFKNVM